jgi:hypothetical protein
LHHGVSNLFGGQGFCLRELFGQSFEHSGRISSKGKVQKFKIERGQACVKCVRLGERSKNGSSRGNEAQMFPEN